MKATEVYRAFRTELVPVMKRLGFTRLKGTSRPGWHRPLGDRFVHVHLWVGTYGWMSSIGCSVTLDFTLLTEPKAGNGAHTVRFHELFHDVELFDFCQRNRDVASQWPTIVGDDESATLHRSLQEGQRQVIERPRPDGDEHALDPWMYYYTLEDAQAWAAWIAPRLERMIGDYEARVRDV